MQNLKVTIIQSELVYENPTQNLANFSEKLNSIKVQTDIIVFPEMFTTSFSLNSLALAETMDGETVHWMLKKAYEKKSLLVGSVIIKENFKYYNRLIVAFPNGEVKTYNKRHLVPLFGEDTVYTAGVERLIFNYKGWKICPLICYDLRFPVWARNTVDFDLLIYVANWPMPRVNAWDILLKARAIENVSYVAGVNSVGVDEDNQVYFGHSGIFDCLGEEITTIGKDKEQLQTVTLDKGYLEDIRKRLPFLNGRDGLGLLSETVYK